MSTEQEYLLARQNQKAFAHGCAWNGRAGKRLAAGGGRGAPAAVRRSGAGDRRAGAERQSAARRSRSSRPHPDYIIERNALPNAYVQPDTKLYTIADLSTVWVYANVFQDDVGRLKPGDPAQVTVDAYPGRKFNGRIDQILPQVDPATRTVRVRLVFRNPGVVLKPGMYVNVDIDVPLGKQLVIPASAVLQSGTRAIAFIDHGDGNLEPREIEIGPQIDDSIVVLKGLEARRPHRQLGQLPGGLRSAASGGAGIVRCLHSRSDCRRRDAACRAAADPDRIDHRPSTPQKGSNTVRIKLTGADGKPVDGAQVIGHVLHAGHAGDGHGGRARRGHAGRQRQRHL